MALILTNAVVPSATIVAMGILIGSLPTMAHAGTASVAGHRTFEALGCWAGLIVLGEIGARLLAATASSVSLRVGRSLQLRIVSALNRPWSIHHLEAPRTADLLAQVSGLGVGAIGPGDAVSGLVTSRIPLILRNAAAGALLFTYCWQGALLLLAAQFIFVRQIRRNWLKGAKTALGQTEAVRRTAYYRDLALGPGTAKEMRMLSLSGWLGDRMGREWMTGLLDEWRQGRMALLYATTGALGASLAAFIVYSSLVVDAAQGVVTIGALILYLRAAQAIGGGWGLSDADYAIEYGLVALPALRELEALASGEFRDAQRALPPLAPSHDVRLENVYFAYNYDEPVLKDLSISIPAGSSFAIVGLNGAGKTTLVKLLARLYDPTSGAITIDGVDLREVDPEVWHGRVAAIFQDFLRLGLSARDNIGFGSVKLQGDENVLAWAAEKAGVLDRIRALPKGWDTPLMRQFSDGTDLSGGEWQRVALARALMAVRAGARFLILDEPTAALDVRAEADFFDRFLDITAGLTTVLISHRFSTVRRAQRICVLDHGSVLECGTHAELMDLRGKYADLFTLQSQRFTEGTVQ